MRINHDPIKRFINGVTAGMKSQKGTIHPKRDEAYDIGFRAGQRNQSNNAFIDDFLHFWLDYSRFMREEPQDDGIDEPCDDIDKHEDEID